MSDRPVSPLATVPEETPGHGLLAGKKVVVTAAAGSSVNIPASMSELAMVVMVVRLTFRFEASAARLIGPLR